jgi:hypothetical protein
MLYSRSERLNARPFGGHINANGNRKHLPRTIPYPFIFT